MARRFTADRAGAMAPMFAAVIAFGAVLMILVVGEIFAHLHKRELQAQADLAVLLAVRDQTYSAGFISQVLADQGDDPDAYAITVTPGRYHDDPDRPRAARFEPGVTPYNAARVRLASEGRNPVARRGGRAAEAEAVAARRDVAVFSLGSRLVRLEGGASGAVLKALLDYDGRITANDYEAIAAARVDALDFLDALALEAGIEAVTYDDVLGSEVELGHALRAAVDVAGAEAPAGLRALPVRSGRRYTRLPVSDLLAIPPGRAPLPEARGTGAQLTLADLLTASALAASSDRQIDVRADAGAARVKLGVGERPQSSGLQLFAGPGASADTRQLELDVSVGGGLNLVDVSIEDAVAHARLAELRCGPGTAVSARFEVTTSAARAHVRVPALLGGRRTLASVDLSDGGVQEVTLTRADIESGKPVTVRSGLGAQVSLLGLNLPLGGVVNGALGAADDVVTALGLTVGEADLFLRDAECGRPYLVQ